MTPNAAAGVLGVVFLATLAAGPTTFAVATVALSIVLLADLADALAVTGPRPVTLAAAIPGIGLPAVIAVEPGVGWEGVPDFVAGGVLAAFVAVLVFGRRRGVTAALGATALAGVVVGLGASGVLLLRSLPDGVHWVLGVVLLVTVVNGVRTYGAIRAKPVPAGAATVAVALLGAGALVVAAAPPFTLASATGIAAVALLAVAAADLLREAITDAGGAEGDTVATPPARRRPGLFVSAALPVLLAAPAAFALARMAAT